MAVVQASVNHARSELLDERNYFPIEMHCHSGPVTVRRALQSSNIPQRTSYQC